LECKHDKYLEFVIHITEDPFGRKRLPDKFVEFLVGREPAGVKSREVSYGFYRWPIEVFFNGQGKMYLDNGFEKLARSHSLKAGCLLHFLYEDDGDLSVGMFDNLSFRMHFHDDSDKDNNNNDDDDDQL
jgi:hypothetical protein